MRLVESTQPVPRRMSAGGRPVEAGSPAWPGARSPRTGNVVPARDTAFAGNTALAVRPEARAPALSALCTLSAGDVGLLALLAEGLPLDAVSRRLELSERTVRRRVRAVCDRLGVRAPIQAVVWAAHAGLI